MPRAHPYPHSFKAVPRLAQILEPERNSFGVIRLTMALAVLVSHCFYLASGSGDSEPLRAWTGYTLGAHGVQVFFIVSGLLVTQSLANSRSVLDFAVGRTLRIFPGLIACVALVALFLGPIVSDYDALSYFSDRDLPTYVLKTLFLTTGSAHLPQVFTDQPVPDVVNVSLWTLKYEVLCYVALGGLGAILFAVRPHRALVISALAAVLAFVLIEHPRLGQNNSFTDNFRYFALFFGTGVAAYAARRHLPITAWVLPPLFALFVVAIGTRWTELASALFLGYAALWIASFRLGPLGGLAQKYDLSYGTYIYGVPVTQTLLHFWPSLGLAALIALTIAIVVPLAYISWTFVERPALVLRRHACAAITTAIASLGSAMSVRTPRPRPGASR